MAANRHIGAAGRRGRFEQELAAWKAAIVRVPLGCRTARRPGGEAVPLLQQFYHLGITSRNSTLRWFKGAFEEGPDGSAAAAPAPLSVLDAARTSLDAETSPHPAPPHPTLAPHPRH
ncbi:hypothetical protein CHLRE_12g550468v5 [Chlamydomonas reinhardtii]|uniref:Uncharacterized protein n=1 Tax=Chlamydomonas reinhardtii TaxID=3055 RepID=A0A2K3D673_CHLRE|nr:uncharacterized protein CHLRE_12g550468v5 [Chlamydomonas reinhardtii]PNW76031.1 hypothetical protein CHLRE_12g550468v5 [Chlamydomonas reinhardtii]